MTGAHLTAGAIYVIELEIDKKIHTNQIKEQ